MKRSWILCQMVIASLIIPILACGPIAASKVTPTPTKTPKRVRTVVPLVSPTVAVAVVLPTNTFTPDVPPPTDTPTPLPATDTPTPEPTPTETFTPLPPTNTPIPPPPPPTNTPVPPPPPPPAPAAPPPPPPSSKPQVIVELPDGNTFDSGDKFEIKFVVSDPDGVWSFTWGIFTQNLTSLMGDEILCHNSPKCEAEVEVIAPPFEGTFIVGADAVDSAGNLERGIGEIYIQ